MTIEFTVYALYDENGELRYVGQTTRGLAERLGNHLREYSLNKKSHLYCWLRSMVDRDELPTIKKIAEAENQVMLDIIERRLISHYREIGYDLVNISAGGGGSYGRKFSEETKRKLSDGSRGELNGMFNDSISNESIRALVEEGYSNSEIGKKLGTTTRFIRRRKKAMEI